MQPFAKRARIQQVHHLAPGLDKAANRSGQSRLLLCPRARLLPRQPVHQRPQQLAGQLFFLAARLKLLEPAKQQQLPLQPACL